MSDFYVYSTLTASVVYTDYESGGADIPVLKRAVEIGGGSNLPDKYLRTPRGVVTPVTAEEAEFLGSNELFQLHEKNGFVKLEAVNIDPEKVVTSGMEPADQSAPLVTEDFPEDQAPVTNQPEPTVQPPEGRSTRNSRRA